MKHFAVLSFLLLLGLTIQIVKCQELSENEFAHVVLERANAQIAHSEQFRHVNRDYKHLFRDLAYQIGLAQYQSVKLKKTLADPQSDLRKYVPHALVEDLVHYVNRIVESMAIVKRVIEMSEKTSPDEGSASIVARGKEIHRRAQNAMEKHTGITEFREFQAVRSYVNDLIGAATKTKTPIELIQQAEAMTVYEFILEALLKKADARLY